MTFCVMLVLVAMRVSASGVEAQPGGRKPRLRAVTGSGRVEEVRVAARMATRLRFDTALDGVHTHLHDTRGRFEPLVLGKDFLVVTPREELPEGEQVTLQVVLAEGTRLPFALVASPTEVDVQVRVARSDPRRPVRVSTAWRERLRGLREGRAEWPERQRAREGEGAGPPHGARVTPARWWGWPVVVTGALPRDEGARFELEPPRPGGVSL